MMVSMKVKLLMGKNTALGNIISRMEISTKDKCIKGKCKVKASIHGLIKIHFKALSSKIK